MSRLVGFGSYACAGVIAVLISACGGATSHPAVTAPTPLIASATLPPQSTPLVAVDQSEVADVSRLDLTFAVSYSSSEGATVEQAIRKVISRSMSERGFTFTPPPRESDSDLERAKARLQVLRFADVDAINSFGYHWTLPNFGVDSIVEPEESSLDGAIGQALDGDASQVGCKTVANDRLAGDGKTALAAADLIVEAQRDLVLEAQVDPALDSLRTAWGLCMDSRGYPNLHIAQSDWLSQYISQPVASPEEILLAQADYQCRIDTEYTVRRLDYSQRKVVEWLAENEGLVTGVQDQIALEVNNANQVIAQG